MNAMTEQTYRPIILSKYTAVLKSCRNLISSEDIRLIRKAFKIAIQNETDVYKRQPGYVPQSSVCVLLISTILYPNLFISETVNGEAVMGSLPVMPPIPSG